MAITIDLKKYNSTLKETSVDSTDGSKFVESAIPAYNFDDISKNVMDELGIKGDKPRSCDALIIKDNEIHFIEFKNKKFSNVKSNDKYSLISKIYNSIYTLNWTVFPDESIWDLINRTTYYVVFNKNKGEEGKADTSLIGLVDELGKLAKAPEITEYATRIDGLFNKKGILFKEIHILDKDDFLKVYSI